MIIKQASSNPDKVHVTFWFPASIWLESIHLVGDFNQWNRHTLPLERSPGSPDWQVSLELVRGREYQFRYLLNNSSWCNDCSADRYVVDPYGRCNSVLET
ncbi:MAG TPA: glycoside hydrolase family 13 [Chloroflexi bacterium]|jgi:1,4-alpha-glucan branching enzyme|nr:glycoside hydrolase family 13 [Chloroflexota bacterium]